MDAILAAMGVTAKAATAAGAAYLAYATACGVAETTRYLFGRCHTVLPDGSVSEAVDSIHLRTWLLGLAVPGYRRTAMAGFGKCLLMTLVTVACAFVALSLAYATLM